MSTSGPHRGRLCRRVMHGAGRWRRSPVPAPFPLHSTAPAGAGSGWRQASAYRNAPFSCSALRSHLVAPRLYRIRRSLTSRGSPFRPERASVSAFSRRLPLFFSSYPFSPPQRQGPFLFPALGKKQELQEDPLPRRRSWVHFHSQVHRGNRAPANTKAPLCARGALILVRRQVPPLRLQRHIRTAL